MMHLHTFMWKQVNMLSVSNQQAVCLPPAPYRKQISGEGNYRKKVKNMWTCSLNEAILSEDAIFQFWEKTEMIRCKLKGHFAVD